MSTNKNMCLVCYLKSYFREKHVNPRDHNKTFKMADSSDSQVSVVTENEVI